MSTEGDFDAKRLVELFGELDEEFRSDPDTSGPQHIAIAGGAAVSLTISGHRRTADVDVVSEGMSASLRRAVALVVERRNLRSDWINDGAKLKTVAVEPELERVFSGSFLPLP